MTLEFSGITLPPLWTVAQAKAHLHLTDAAYDADVQQKLDAAQDEIIRYLNAGADPTWTPATAPPGVKNAILLLLAYYYAERGDGNTPDPWPVIHQNCAVYRDPTVA